MSDGLPHDEHTERVLLGTLLRGGDIAAVSEILRPAAFFMPSHADVFRALMAADQSEDRRVSSAAIARRMRDAGHPAAGLLSRLTALEAHADPKGTETGHARHLAKVARRRVGMEVARLVEARLRQDPEAEPAAVLAAAMADLETDAPQAGGWISHGDLVARQLDVIAERARNPNEVPGAPTGLPDLDRLLGGLQPGKSILIAGRPAMGKSALAHGFALSAAQAGVGVGWITLEMPGDEVAERSLAMDARVNNGQIRSGEIHPDAWRRLDESRRRLADLPIWIDDSPAASIAQIIGKVRRLKSRHPEVGVVLLDYLQLATAEGGKGQSRQQEIGRISRGMKELAKEQGVCCLSLAQLSRRCEERTDKRPTPSDLREAGDLEQDADGIVFIYRDEVYNRDTPKKGRAELIVGKNRGGGTGTVTVRWIGSETRFAPLDPEAPPQAGRDWHAPQDDDRW